MMYKLSEWVLTGGIYVVAFIFMLFIYPVIKYDAWKRKRTTKRQLWLSRPLGPAPFTTKARRTVMLGNRKATFDSKDLPGSSSGGI